MCQSNGFLVFCLIFNRIPTNGTHQLRSNRMRITAMQSARRSVQRAPLRQHRRLNSVCIKRRLVNFRVRYQIIQIEIIIGTVMVFVSEMVQVKIAISDDIKKFLVDESQSSYCNFTHRANLLTHFQITSFSIFLSFFFEWKKIGHFRIAHIFQWLIIINGIP